MASAFRPLVPMSQLLWLITFAALVSNSEQVLGTDADLVTHIAIGRTLLEQGFPDGNPWLFTTGITLALHEWLFEVLAALLDRPFGLVGPFLVLCALGALVPCAVFGVLRDRGAGLWTALGAALLTLLAAKPHLIARPHLVTLAVLPLWWRGVVAVRDNEVPLPRAVAAFGGATVLWANLHGGFLYGLLVIAAAAAGELATAAWDPRERPRVLLGVKRLSWLGLGVATAACINPYGPMLYVDMARFLLNRPMQRAIADFAPVVPGNPVFPLLVVVVVLLLGGLFMARGALGLRDAVMLLPFAGLAVLAGRHVAVFGIVGGLVVADLLERAMAAAGPATRLARARVESSELAARLDPPQRGGWRWKLAGAVVAAAVVGWVGVSPPRMAPVQALDYLRRHDALRQSRGFTDYTVGGYVLYGTPVAQVFIHPLNAFYPADGFRTYIDTAYARPGWREVFDRYDLRWAIVDHDRPLAAALHSDPGWQVATRDLQSVMFVRRPAPAAEERFGR